MLKSIITLVFFITYVMCQPPSTVIVRKIGPRIHLSLITILWGALMIGMGFVKEWTQLAVLRVVLGILEAGFFPSCVYLLSTWYTRCESPRNPMALGFQRPLCNMLPELPLIKSFAASQTRWASGTPCSISWAALRQH
jgi:MFS family permease